MEKETVEKDARSGRRFLTFLAGSAFGVGAGLLVSKACCALGRSGSSVRSRNTAKEDRLESTPYCAVPEGADICYPE